MWLKLSTLALLPVLFVQGTKVRKNTPRLLEASGERQGIVGKGKPLSLLILGDSAAAGVGVENQKMLYLVRLFLSCKINIRYAGNCMQNR